MFSEEDPDINSKEYQLGDEVNNSKNEWINHAAQPGVDRSEFYNPNLDEDLHNQSVNNPNTIEHLHKQPSETKLSEDRLHGGDDRNTCMAETAAFHK